MTFNFSERFNNALEKGREAASDVGANIKRFTDRAREESQESLEQASNNIRKFADTAQEKGSQLISEGRERAGNVKDKVTDLRDDIQGGKKELKGDVQEFFEPEAGNIRPRDIARESAETVGDAAEFLSPPSEEERRANIREDIGGERRQSLDPESLNPNLERRIQKEVFERDLEEGVVRPGALSPDQPGSDVTIDFTGAVGTLRNRAGDASKEALESATNKIKSYADDVMAKDPEPKTIKDRVFSAFDGFYENWVDKYNPVTKMANKAKQATDEDITGTAQDPSMLIRRYLGNKGIAESKLFWKNTELDEAGNLREEGQSLIDAIEPVKNNLDDLQAYQIARRDLELAQREGDRAIEGVNPERAQETIDAIEQKYGQGGLNKIQSAADDVTEYAKNAILKPLRNQGLISEDDYKNIVDSNQFYAPFKRQMDELENQGLIQKSDDFEPSDSGIEQINYGAEGSDNKIIPPLESVINDTYRTTEVVERARVVNSIIDLRQTSDEMKELIEPVSPDMVPVAQDEAGEAVFRPSMFKPDDDVLMRFEDGKKKYYRVEQELADSLSNMSSGEANILERILQVPTKTLRAGATLDPDFAVRNPLRDNFSSFVNSKFNYNPPFDLPRGIYSFFGGDDAYRRWQAAGGDQSMFVSLDRAANQEKIADLKKKADGNIISMRDIKKRGKNPIKLLRDISEGSETGTRLGVFKASKRKGASDLESAFESRDAVTDFARMGSQMEHANRIIAFLNARVQGLNKIGRAFKNRPVSTGAKTIGGITMPSIGLYLANRDNPRYQQEPQWKKDLYWNIYPEGDDPDGTAIRIPKPFEIGWAFGTVPERVMQEMDNRGVLDDVLGEPAGVAKTGGLEGVVSKSGDQTGLSVKANIPTAAKPVIENMTNYSFFRERPIVSQSLQNLPAEMQSKTYTSETAQQIGGIIGMSPLKVENMVQGWSGGLGRRALGASDKILEAAGITDTTVEPAKKLSDQPFVGAVIGEQSEGAGTAPMNQFYDIYKKSIESEQGAKEIAETEGPEAAAKFIKEHPEQFFAGGMRKANRSLSKLRKKKKKVQESDKLSAKEKREALDSIDKIMTSLAKDHLKTIKAVQENPENLPGFEKIMDSIGERGVQQVNELTGQTND